MNTKLAKADAFLGHPKGLFVCFFTEMWERFSFYGMKALLALFLIKHHAFTDTQSYAVLGAYGGLVYAAPVLGGILADRYLGMRKAVVLGGVLLCLGHLGMSYEGHSAGMVAGSVVRDDVALAVFFLSLSLIVAGVGFLKPNISTLVGQLYPEGDPRRDSGFTLFYAGINIGALFASLVCGYLGEVYGWRYGFGAAGIGMVAGLLVFVTGQKHLMGLAEPPNPAALRRAILGPITVEWAIYLGSFAVLPLLWLLMQWGHKVLYVQVGLMLLWLGWLGWFVRTQCTPAQRRGMLACVFYVFVGLLFYSLYEQTYGSWVLFTDRMLNKDLFPALIDRSGTPPLPWSVVAMIASPLVMTYALRARDTRAARGIVGGLALVALLLVARDCVVLPQTAGSLTFLGALFIVLLSPLFVWLWPALERRGLNPSKPIKSAIGLACAGLAFVPLMLANQSAAGGVLASVWWLVLAYFILEIGEMCLSPVGLSAVTELSVPSAVGFMMGAWWLGTSMSEQFAALMGSLAAMDSAPGEGLDLALAAAKYQSLFQMVVAMGLGAAVVTVAGNWALKRRVQC